LQSLTNYTRFLWGCARRCSTRCISLHLLRSRLCSQMLDLLHRRCSTRCIACTCFFGRCARRCSTRRIACSFSFAVVLADGRPAALLAPASFAAVRALCALSLHIFPACTYSPTTAHFFSMKLLLGLVAFLGRGTLPDLHSLFFAFAFDLHVFVSMESFCASASKVGYFSTVGR
jgi:hypothetical protein